MSSHMKNKLMAHGNKPEAAKKPKDSPPKSLKPGMTKPNKK